MAARVLPIGDVDAHDTLYRRLERMPPARVLDVPCGRGACAQFLVERGWDVHCADIDPDLLVLEGVPFTAVNLNRELGFADESFDVVVCANALHRLFNVGGAVREFHRVLRPGGRLIVNANNYANVVARLRFLVAGSMDSRVNDGLCQQTIDHPEANLRFYLLYPQIANVLQDAGFEITEVAAAAVRRSHRLLAPLAWAVRLLALAIPRARRRQDHVAVTASSAVLGGGRYMYIEARKPGAS